MDLVKITLHFPNVSAQVLEDKSKSLIERFNLSAEYHDNTLTIIGPRPILEQISAAYQMQKMLHNGFGAHFNV